MIAKDIVANAYRNGVAVLREVGRNGSDVVCYIGDYWFRFAGENARTFTLEQVKAIYSVEEIVNMIHHALEVMKDDIDRAWYYDYFSTILSETNAD